MKLTLSLALVLLTLSSAFAARQVGTVVLTGYEDKDVLHFGRGVCNRADEIQLRVRGRGANIDYVKIWFDEDPRPQTFERFRRVIEAGEDSMWRDLEGWRTRCVRKVAIVGSPRGPGRDRDGHLKSTVVEVWFRTY